MGTLLRLLVTRFLPGRFGWLIAAWLIARLMARRQEASTARPAPRRVQPVPVPVQSRRAR